MSHDQCSLERHVANLEKLCQQVSQEADYLRGLLPGAPNGMVNLSFSLNDALLVLASLRRTASQYRNSVGLAGDIEAASKVIEQEQHYKQLANYVKEVVADDAHTAGLS